MTNKIILTVLIALLLNFSGGCKSQPEGENTSPEMARSMVKLRGYEFDKEGFFTAIKAKKPLIVDGFLKGGMDPNTKNEKGETALTYAVQNSPDEITKIILEKADVNMQDDLGNSPLYLAITEGKDEIFNALLEKNADVNVTGSKGKVKNITPLYAAILNNREDYIKALIEKKADPNIADSGGSYPLTDAVIGRRANPRIVKMLIDNGADVNKTEEKGAPPLVYIAANKDINPQTRKEIVQLLLDKGAKKDGKDAQGNNALYWAKKYKHDETAELLK